MSIGQLIIHLPWLHLLEVGEFRLEMKDSIQCARGICDQVGNCAFE
jgi:hypothetical protein